MSVWVIVLVAIAGAVAVLFVRYGERVCGYGCALVLWVIERWRGDNEYDD